MPGYSWLTLTTALAQLAQRLNDPSFVFWNQAELVFYIQQALRQFNALTFQQKANFIFSSPDLWNSLGSLTGSPRLRTLTDTYCYTQMQYMLLEPPNGGATWSGTTQFTLDDFTQALQTRRDEMLQVSNCNQSLMPNIALTPNIRRTFLPDTVIDVARTRYQALITTTAAAGSIAGVTTIPVTGGTAGIAIGQMVFGTGINPWTTVTGVGSGFFTISIPSEGSVTGTLSFLKPNTLYRDDTVALEFYESPLYQIPSGTPQTYQMSSEPPLSFDVDIPPVLPGFYEAVVSQSGTAFNPPASTLLGIPDDYAWVLIWGALADLLGRESEATDRERSAYCLKRYQDGLLMLLKTPWIMLGSVNGIACTVDSIYASDRYMPEWDSAPLTYGPSIITGGIDFFASPVNLGVGLTVLGNMPVPSAGGDFIQVSRSDWDIILDLAQCLACFKMGGAEFKQALELEQRAIQACAAENARLRSFGAFSDILIQRGQAQERDMNPYNGKNRGQ